MESAARRLKDRLLASKSSYGFFFYAGHAVQSGGENYMIPVDANIQSENLLRQRAVSLQYVLDELNEAKNALNIVVLDACRDFPAAWSRTANRGLAMVHPPANSIIMYATAAGRTASDGEGRNGLFTSHLLKNLTTPGTIEVNELFRRTMGDVSRASNDGQRPALYTDFSEIAYLGTVPGVSELKEEAQPVAQIQTMPVTPQPAVPKKIKPPAPENAKLWTIGAGVGSSFAAPWIVGTMHGTIAPWHYSFLEIGLDAGFLSGVEDAGYYSIYPFLHYAFFLPFSNKGGWYIGAGGGYLIAEYNFSEEKVPVRTFGLDLTTGFNLWDMLDVSYTLRTNFSTVGNKVSVGYTYRF
jgi:hypothetical protein